MDYRQFASTIKNKYPEYSDVDDKVLAEKIIAKYPEYKSKVEFPEETKKQGISQGLQALLQGSKVFTPEESVRNPKAVAQTALQAAQFAGGAIPLGGSVPVTAATQYGIKRLAGATSPEALKSAEIAGLADAAITAATGGLPPIFGKFASRAITGTPMVRPVAAKVLAGIPKKATETAIKGERMGQSIFQKIPTEKRLEDLAVQTKNKMNELTSKAGKAVGEAKSKVKNIKDKFDISDIDNSLENQLNETIVPELGSSLDATDLRTIDLFKQKLSLLKNKQATPEQLINLKETAHNLVDSYPISDVAKTQTNGQRILKGIAEELRNKIDEIADEVGIPELKKFNKQYHEAQTLKGQLLPVLGGKTPSATEKKLYDIFESSIKGKQPITPYAKELTQLSPETAQEYIKLAAARQYEDILPKGSGDITKGGAVASITSLLLGHPEVAKAYIGLLAAMSPKTHKALIKLSNPLIALPSKLSTRKTIINLLGNRED